MLEKIKSMRLLFRMIVWAMAVSSSGLVETAEAVTTCDKNTFEGFFLAPDTKTTVAITKQAYTWGAAAAVAKAAGGRLVVVTGSEQNSSIATNLSPLFTNISTMTSTPQKKAWIDLVDPLNSPAWTVEGSPAVVMPSRFSWADDFSSFSNWASGQPDGYCPAKEQALHPDHNCYGEPWATINSDGTWSDEGNHSTNNVTLKGVVEWPLVTLDCVAPVSPPTVTDPGPLPDAATGAQYCTNSTKTLITKCDDSSTGGKLCPNDRVACNAVYDVPSCPSGSVLNTQRDMCQAEPVTKCGAGYSWDVSLDRCVAAVVCPEGGVLNPATDQCEKLVLNQCPDTYAYDGNSASATYGKCVKPVVCSPGTFNPSTDRCEAPASSSCSTAGFSYNAATSKCEMPPTCAAGMTYNPTYNKCVQAITTTCQSGYVYVPASDRCEKNPPECSSGTYNTFTNRCEAQGYDQIGNPVTSSSTLSGSLQSFSLDATSTTVYACGIKADNTLKCWYVNSSNQPVDFAVPPGNFYDVGSATGTYFWSCALRDDNTAVCWYYPSTATPSSVTYFASPAYKFKDISAGSDPTTYVRACGVTVDDQTICWQYTGGYGNPNAITYYTSTSGTKTSDVAAGDYINNCGLDQNGALKCTYTTNSTTAAQNFYTPTGPFIDVSTSSSTYVNVTAIESNGSVKSWYYSSYSALQTSLVYRATVPGSYRDIDTAIGTYLNACGVTTTGQINCWFYTGTSTYTFYASPTGTFDEVQMSPDGKYLTVCGRKTDNTLSCWDYPGGYGNPSQIRYLGVPTDQFANTQAQKLSCSAGLAPDSTAALCFANPTCTNGSFDGTKDVCFGPYTPSCSAGTYDSASGFCVSTPTCGEGFLNGVTDLCEASPKIDCGTQSWDSTAGVCYSSPVCLAGSYDAILNTCTAALSKDCGTYSLKDAMTCQMSPPCASDPSFSLNSTATYTPSLDKCVSQTQHDCVTGTTYAGQPIMKCEAVPICMNGLYLPETDTCFKKDQTCPIGNFACQATAGDTTQAAPGVPMQYCSPNACQSDTSGWIKNTDTESGIEDKKNDGERGVDGNCLGSIYLYNGTDMRCRLRDLNGATNSYLQLAAMIALSITGAGAALAGALGAAAGSTTAMVIEATVQMAVSAAIDAATTGVDAMGVIISGVGAMAGAAAGEFADVGADGLGDMVADSVASAGLSSGIDVLADPALSDIIQQIGNTVEQYQPEITKGLLSNYSATKCCYPDKMSGGCKPEEFTEAKLAGNGACHIVGSYCSSKVLAFCMVKKQTSCCFTSKLARIFHEQGRPQLTSFGEDGAWGLPRHPNCRGFTPEEFQSLNFGAMDLSEYIEDLNTRMDQVQPLLEQYMGTFGNDQKTKLNNQFQSGVPQQ